MGKKILVQRRGKGSSVFKAKPGKCKVAYPYFPSEVMKKGVKAQVLEIFDDPMHSAAVAEVLYENGIKAYHVAAEGLQKDALITLGENADIAIGNVLPLSKIPEGCPIFAIEKTPNDGGKLVRASGSYAFLVTKDKNYAYVKLPSGKQIKLDLNCRATIGNASGGGRTEKPFVKAGKKYHYAKSRGKKYPIVRGVAMNPVSHPFGGSQHHPGKSKSVSRHAPPGRKVGHIASRRTGRKKR